jgi:hypothetical protein
MAAAVVGLNEAARCAADRQCARHSDGRPHTRPVTLTAHATDTDLVTGLSKLIDRVEVPASFTGLLEFRLGQADRKAMGFAAHVPHYLAQASLPRSHVVADPVAELRHWAGRAARAAGEGVGRNLADIAEEMQGSSEVQELVATLEQQYDASQAERADRMPSAEEIAAEFEKFLADREKND